MCNQTIRRGGDNCSTIFCLNDCTENGLCIDGYCQCYDGFNSTDCSIMEIILIENK